MRQIRVPTLSISSRALARGIVPTLSISSRALARAISGPWMPRRSGGIEDARFFHQQANWCYQLAWQCFDLAVAHELNLMGNKLTANARELWSQERKAR